MQKINKLLQTIKKQRYHDVVVDKENDQLLTYLHNKGINKKSLNAITLDKNWNLCFDQELNPHSLSKKIKLFTTTLINFQIQFVNILPVINSYSTTILITGSSLNEFQEYWKEFQYIISKSDIAPDRLAKSDLLLVKIGRTKQF